MATAKALSSTEHI
ncbi:hypothetical protein FOXB_16160 [Fusarium oxysporum f. sp. conglutinans Fo5176]|uniref:Uncharacterized protein n=1 Tax=Fusarium oxysporum (strain Fo5176) TaxID=660025 RepID=F9GBX7_FUSOF|nr:hypothetical protein FOXB_16160 [Fusarium oxysporum f. sp. conglutinans Fo5176]